MCIILTSPAKCKPKRRVDFTFAPVSVIIPLQETRRTLNMIDSAYSLYKLIILYMLDKVDYPMTGTQINDLVLGQRYTTYFHLQEVISEMLETSLVQVEMINHTAFYRLTEQGAQTLAYFGKDIPPEIRRDIDSYLEKHSYAMRNDSSTWADYRQTSSHEYTVHCVATENGSPLVEISFTVPTEASASALAENWRRKSQEAYEALVRILT